MLQRHARSIALALGLLALLAGGAAVSPAPAPPAPAAEVKSPKVKALLKERLATLQEIADLTLQAVKAGRALPDRLLEANKAVRKAELDLAETNKERVAILEKGLAEAKEYEKLADARVKAGAATVTSALEARAYRLEVEIALERARGK